MSKSIVLDGINVGEGKPCYVIAEIGNNHQGSVELCKEMILAAKQSGASAVKLQKRENSKIFTKALFDSPYENPNSFGPTYGSHRNAIEFGEAEYKELISFSKDLGITFFSTAFDLYSLELLEQLEMPFYKVASSDITHLPLLKTMASFGKPMILSTGGATMDDIHRALDAVLPLNNQVVLMQCTAAYPPVHKELNLNVIRTFSETFKDVVVGLSSHDNGIAMDLVGYILGAQVIEKHFTLNRANKGTDNAFSLEPQGLQKLVRDLERARVSLGDGHKVVYDSEKAPITKMRKKIVFSRDLKAGHVLTKDDFEFKSPADALPPYRIDECIGQTLGEDVMIDQDVDLNQFRK